MSLKRLLEDPASSLRAFLAARLPEIAGPRAHFRHAMHGAHTLLPDESRPPWDVLGHAISARLLWELDPAPGGHIAGRSSVDLLSYVDEPAIVEQFGRTIDEPPSELTADEAARVAWIAGLLDRAFRSGRSDDPHLDRLRPAESWEQLLARVPDACANDISTVATACLPLIEPHRSAGVRIAPTFAGSLAVGGADADYITGDGLLVDVKATKDPKLRLRDLQQIVCYALLDWTDEHDIGAVGILAARQGCLVTWQLRDLLCEMAGCEVDVGSIRDTLRREFAH